MATTPHHQHRPPAGVGPLTAAPDDRPDMLPLGLQWGTRSRDSATLWLTGPPHAGVATVARAVRSALTAEGRTAHVIDNEQRLDRSNSDFATDRALTTEHARHAADAAANLVIDGIVAIVAIPTHHIRDREHARRTHEQRRLAFYEIFVDTHLRRHRRPTNPADTLTPYEPPPLPDLIVTPDPLVLAVAAIVALL